VSENLDDSKETEAESEGAYVPANEFLNLMAKYKWQYSGKMGAIIAKKVLDGSSLTAVSRLDGFPPLAVIKQWEKDHSDFSEALRMARSERGEYYADQIHDMAIDATVRDRDELATEKHRADQLRWLAEKANPNRYGRTVETSGGPSSVVIKINTGIDRTVKPDIEAEYDKEEEVKQEIKPAVAKEDMDQGIGTCPECENDVHKCTCPVAQVGDE
jgi:hypothetical protein